MINITARLLNSIADCYAALRLAGFSVEEASRIVTEEVGYQYDLMHEAARRRKEERDREQRTIAG